MNKCEVKKLEYYRKSSGLTQAELAEIINVERYRISDWEQGRSQPSIENLIKLANALNVSIESLVDTEHIKVEESSNEMILNLIRKNY